MEEQIITEAPDLRSKDFRKLCLKLGGMMIIIVLSRIIASTVLKLLSPFFMSIGGVAAFSLEALVSFLLIYLLPMSAIYFALGFRKTLPPRNKLYVKPPRFAKSVAYFPAAYGLGQIANILTIVVTLLVFTKDYDFNKAVNTSNDLIPSDMLSALVLFSELVIIAPLFEEFWFRGMVFSALRPYGTGFAIIVQGVLFGFTHGNFSQFFYTSVLGIVLGYICYATNSLLPSTVIHALFNSVSGISILFLATSPIRSYVMNGQLPADASDADTSIMVLFVLYTIVAFSLCAVGIVMAIKKLIQIKRYKVLHSETALPLNKRVLIFLSSFTVIIGVLLAADIFTNNYIIRGIYKLLQL